MTFRLTLLAAVALFASGCDGFSDFVDDPVGDFALKLNVRDAAIPLGDGLTARVTPERPSLVEETVDLDLDIESIERITDLRIRPEDLRFTPSADGAAEARMSGQTGTVSGFVGFNYPITNKFLELLSFDVVITDGEVSSITLSSQRYANRFIAVLEGYGYEAGDYSSFEEARQAAVDILSDYHQLDFVLVVETTGTLSGDLSLDQIEFDGVVTP